MSVDHYENFPVASLLLPKALRPAVRNIYVFARSADDIADEGNANPQERLQALATYERALDSVQQRQPLPLALKKLNPVFEPLAASIRQHNLPLQPFYDLLSAFKQDVSVKRYANLAQLLDYSQRSADPVGRLMLALYQCDSAQAYAWSDAICSGLQLVNFWQDVAIDWHKDRVYIPLDHLSAHGLDEEFINACVHGTQRCTINPAWSALMQSLTHDARQRLLYGAPLLQLLKGRIAFELKFIILGGLRILERLEAVEFDVFTQRPTLNKADWTRLAYRSLRRLPSI